LKKGFVLSGDREQVAAELKGVRFHNKKAKYIIEARHLFKKNGTLSIKPRLSNFETPIEARDWLVRNIKGLGFKEASHLLRNVGMGQELAILDRHILKNLATYGVIEKVPASISKKKYLEIEKHMTEFSRIIKIPVAHLDLLFWYKETGEVFK
jgi:N-glycosylase/DNA lyase